MTQIILLNIKIMIQIWKKLKKDFLGFIKLKMNRKPIITSIKTYYLTFSEKKLFKKEKPWGIILFKRNIKSFNQVKIINKRYKNDF